MIASPLLEKIRLVNKILQKEEGKYVDYEEIAGALRDVILADVYFVDLEGTFISYALVSNYECEIIFKQALIKRSFTERFNTFLLKSNELRCNLEQGYKKCIFTDSIDCLLAERISTIIPIIGRDRRLGTLLLTRFNEPFTEEDLILAEGGATMVAMEILRKELAGFEKGLRNISVVKLALETLSYSEMEVMGQLFKDFTDNEGLLVASKVADNMGIARSVIVNALRKLESAGLLESWTLGTKGTYIKVHNPYFLKYLGKRAQEK